jgi:hypothetical protein
MIDGKLLWRATLVGIILQVAMAVLAHFIPWIALNVFMFGGMCISGVAGLFYARDLDKGWALGTLGATIAGAVCAAIGALFSAALGDTPANTAPVAIFMFATTLSGAVGGPFGQMAANLRAISNTQR